MLLLDVPFAGRTRPNRLMIFLRVFFHWLRSSFLASERLIPVLHSEESLHFTGTIGDGLRERWTW